MTIVGGSFEKDLLEMLTTLTLVQHVRQPTRAVAEQRQNILDLVFTHEDFGVMNLQLLKPLGHSDHLMLSFNWIIEAELMQPLAPRRNV